MKEYLSAARRKRFCECYLRTLDPVRAAEEAGERDGWALLAEESVRVELDAMRSLRARTVRREDAVRRLAELAFGRANDAVAMALSPEREGLSAEKLDLSAVSEFKVTDKGGVEIRFLDRVKALETLCGLLERQEAEALYRDFGKMWERLPDTWRTLVLSSHTEFERSFGHQAKKNRKLYNGMIKCDLFMYGNV